MVCRMAFHRGFVCCLSFACLVSAVSLFQNNLAFLKAKVLSPLKTEDYIICHFEFLHICKR